MVAEFKYNGHTSGLDCTEFKAEEKTWRKHTVF
jgi:hypothetical protein